MGGHQGYPVPGILLISGIHGSEERNVFQEFSQSNQREGHFGFIDDLAFFLDFLEILVLPLFNESRHAVQQLFDVGCPGLALYGRIGLEMCMQAAGIRQCGSEFRSIGIPSLGGESANHVAETAYPGHCRSLQAVFRELFRICSLEHGRSQVAGHRCQRAQRCITYAA